MVPHARFHMKLSACPWQPDLIVHVLLCSQQVKRRCRWLVSFADGELSDVASSLGDPFEGQRIDANMLGGCPDALLPWEHPLCPPDRLSTLCW